MPGLADAMIGTIITTAWTLCVNVFQTISANKGLTFDHVLTGFNLHVINLCVKLHINLQILSYIDILTYRPIANRKYPS